MQHLSHCMEPLHIMNERWRGRNRWTTFIDWSCTRVSSSRQPGNNRRNKANKSLDLLIGCIPVRETLSSMLLVVFPKRGWSVRENVPRVHGFESPSVVFSRNYAEWRLGNGQECIGHCRRRAVFHRHRQKCQPARDRALPMPAILE